MKHGRSKQTRIERIATRTQKTLLPLVAVGGGLASLPAHALELGDVTVESRLGQPLRASIAYALAPHEQLFDSCVTLGLGAPASGLPGVGRTTLSIADGTILLTGKTPVREPMVAAMINIDCAYTPNLSREYLMFIDPAGPALAATVTGQTNASSRTAAESPSPARRAAPTNTARRSASSNVNRTPIGQSTQYRVQSGDTLSQIVQRIENRSTSLWPAVNAIFDANPDAFIDNDPNKLKAGSLLTIPSFLDGKAPVAAVTSTSSASTDNVAASDAVTDIASSTSSATSNTTLADSTSDLRPVRTDAGTNSPFVDGAAITDESVIIADTELEGPVTQSTSPNVTTAVIDTQPEATPSSSSWLLWLAGSGLAIIAALLLFGRLFRGRPAEAEVVPVVPQRRATDRDPNATDDTSGIEVITHTGYTIEDDSPTAENVTLDADLIMGTGLEEGTEIDVAEDFGFASPTEVDLELPFEPEPTIPESDTGIFAMDDDETSLLENNDIADDDDYDLSVVLDATKMPRPDDITQRDLQAVEVEPVDILGKTDSYTIESEVDLEILEQDYEDELTATQALNAEIMRAAEELAKDSAGQAVDDYEITNEMTAPAPLLTVSELDATAQLPSNSDEEEQDTGVHDAATIEMPAADNDETAAMDVDDDKVDFKVI